MHLQHGGKLSLTRVLAGHLDDGATLLSSSGETGRVSGILAVNGAHDTKRASAEAGRHRGTRQARYRQDRRHAVRLQQSAPAALVSVAPSPPVLAIALSATDRKDDVLLSGCCCA